MIIKMVCEIKSFPPLLKVNKQQLVLKRCRLLKSFCDREWQHNDIKNGNRRSWYQIRNRHNISDA